MDQTVSAHHHLTKAEKKNRGIRDSIVSILIAIVSSSHHWVHTLLIALGLSFVGTGLMSLPEPLRIALLTVSVAISLWMLRVAWKKWNIHRAVAWVYVVSSLISLIVVATSLPLWLGSSPAPGVTTNQSQSHNHGDGM